MTDIQLTDTRTREKRRFEPIDPENVRMYVCGPTVYDRAHIGNARPVVVFDVLFRLLRHRYGAETVTYVRNITDIDDKINARARESLRPGEGPLDAIARITAETTRWYVEDMAALGALTPTHEPRATGHIPGMVAMIEALIAKGHAYAAEGHVLFSVASHSAYGTLARRSLDEMQAGARVEVAPYKRDPMDFVLWKPSAPDEPGWDSPWGRGRPGWHIECSAMSEAFLGETFDIHGGGIDLVFPHHENEVAQSCAAHGTERMANYWLHNGYLMVEGEKMSKSLGNFITVKDLRDRGVPGGVIRLVLLMTHYRQPLDWTESKVAEATKVIQRWRRALDAAEALGFVPAEGSDAAVSDAVLPSLMNDLNTWNAIRGLDVMAKRLIDATLDQHVAKDAAEKFCSGLWLLGFEGLEGEKAHETVTHAATEIMRSALSPRIDALLAERQAARTAKDFAKADAIRNGLAAAGVEVTDTSQGPDWTLTPDFDPAKLDDLEALT